MPIKILVTGGAGYLGSILVPELLKKGYHVTVLDNFMYKQSSLNHICNFKNFEIVKGDIRNKSEIIPILKKVDFIIPLAALVGAPLCKLDPVGATSINFDAIIMMLKFTSKNQKIIMPTTNSAYGTGDSNNFCTEESPLNPISQYAIEKVEVEKNLIKLENFISFRLATVFGMSPRMRLDLLVNDFTYRAVHDNSVLLFESHFKRNYIHVLDVARAFLHAIENFEQMKGNVYNVGLSDTNISKMELCLRIKQQVKNFTIVEAPIGKDEDQRNYVVSNEKIESSGFLPQVSLDEGITELLKGFVMIKNSKYGNI